MHACCTLGSEKAPINLGSVRLYACVRLQIRTGGEKPIRSPTRRQSRISKSKVTLSPENNKTTLRLTLFRVFRVFRGLFVYLTLPYSQQPTKTHIKPHVPTYFFLTLRNCTRWITLVNVGLRWFAVKAALQLSPSHPDIFAFVISAFVVRTVPNRSEPFRIYPNPRSPFFPLLGAWRRGQAGSSPFTPINVIRPFKPSQ